MKKRISKKIRDRIISKSDILAIIDYFIKTYKSIESEHKNITISILTDELEKFEIENANLGEDEKILDIKKIEKIDIDFIDYRGNKRMSIELSQGELDWSNNLSIEGNDEEWVNHQNRKLDDYIKSWRPQNKWFSKYKNLLYHFLSINIGFLFIRFLSRLVDSLGYQPSKSSVDDSFLIFILD